jgi:hypothetical protein
MAMTYPPMPAHALAALDGKRRQAETMAAWAVQAFSA